MELAFTINPILIVAAVVIYTVGFVTGVVVATKRHGKPVNLPHIAHASVVFMGIIIAPFSFIVDLNIDQTALVFWIASALAFYGADTGTLAVRAIEAIASSKKGGTPKGS